MKLQNSDTDISLTKALEIMGVEDKDKNQADPKIALALVAYATSHKEALGTIDKNVIDKLFAELNKIEQLANNAKLRLYHSLLSHINLGGDPPRAQAVINPPTMAQLSALVIFHHELGVGHSFNKGEIEQALLKSGKYFYSILEDLDKSRSKEMPVLTADNLATVLKEVGADAILGSDDHKEVRELLLKTVSKPNRDQFDAISLKKLIDICGRYAASDNGKIKLLNMIELINSIDVLHQNTTQLPTIAQLTQALSVIAEQPEDTPHGLLRQLSTLPGFEHCYFGNQKVEEFDPESIKDFLKQAEGEIRAQLGGLIDFEDEDFTDPKLFVQKLKKFEDKIPSMILNPLISKAFNMVKGSHDAVVMQHLEGQLWKGEDKMQNVVAALFKDKIAPVAKPNDLTGLLTLSETMVTRLEEIDKLITTLNAIKLRSTADYEKLVTILNDSPGVSQVPLPVLNKMLEQMNRFHKGKLPIDLVSALVNNSNVKKGFIPNWDDVGRWIMPLVLEKQVHAGDLRAIIDLTLNLSTKQVSTDNLVKVSDFLVKQGEFRKDFIKVFNDMEANTEFANQYGQVITQTMSVMDYLDTQKNSQELKSNFLKTFKNSPHLFAEAIKQISKSAQDDTGKAHLVMILSRMNEGKSAADISESLARQKDESAEFRTERLKKEAKELEGLVDSLVKKSGSFNNALANVDADLGFPLVPDIIAYEQESIDNLLNDMVEKRKIARGAISDQQFDTSQVTRVLEDMQNLATDNPLLYSQRERLQQDVYFINAIGHSHKIRTRPNEADSKSAIIKDMSKNEIQYLIGYYQQLVRDPNTPPDAKRQGRLVYLALLREVMYRTTGCLPFTTQIISVLNAMAQNGNNISEIQTGQGKTLISGLFAAMQHLEGKTVDVCTSNMHLAREGLAETKKFYQYLAIKHAAIDSASDINDYAIGGINYSDVAQLALFRARRLIEGGIEPDSASLILDEADYTLLDDSTQYRYAVNLDDVGDPYYNPFDFAYKLVNDFVNTDEFKNPNATINDDKVNLRKYLIKHAKGAQKDLVRDPEMLSDKQLDVWIDSAAVARELYKQRDKRWTLSEETRFDQKMSVARLIINDRVSPDAQWSNGVQQMLHALINEEDAIKMGKAPACTLDPEKSAVASITSKNFIDYYNKKKGVVWGMTGTIGVAKEKLEHQEKFDFKLTSMPPHQKQRRVDHKPILVETDALHQEKIFQQVLKRIRKNDKMPCVIICKDATTSKALAKYIESELIKIKKNHPLTLQLFNGIDNERVDLIGGKSTKRGINNEGEAVSQAGLQGTITISTPMSGRGTDFKPRKVTKEGLEVKHPFGLFVVQTYLDSERTSRQIVGRGGRQGWFGESMTIISKEALIHDLAATDKSTAQVNQMQLEARMEEVRLYRNYTAKQQRLYSESYGDVRNHYFGKLIQMLDAIPAICEAEQQRLDKEMLKPDVERDIESIKVPDPVQLRKTLLKEWEQYLNNLDSEWKSNLSQPVKPELKDAVSSIARHASSKWNIMVSSPMLQVIGEYQIDEIESTNLMTEVLENPLTSAAMLMNEPFRRLPAAINIHKAYCENLQAIDTLDEKSFKAAYHGEIDSAFQRLKDIITHEKPPSIKWSRTWNDMPDYNAKFRILNEALMQADIKCHKSDSKNRYQRLQTEVLSIITWTEKYPQFKNETNVLKQMLLQSHINHRKKLNNASPELLLEHDRNMQRYSATGFYPTIHDYDNLMKRSTAAWHRIKEDSLTSLKKYQKAFFTSSIRNEQTSKLIKYLSDTNEYDLKGIYKTLLEARKYAHQDDAKSSLKKKLFNNSINFGTRFHKMLNDIEERVIANVNNEKALQDIYTFEKEDLRLLLNAIDAKYAKNELVRAAVQNIKVQILTQATWPELQQSLQNLSGMLGNEKRLRAAVINKITHLCEIDIRLSRLAIKEAETLSAPEVNAKPILTSELLTPEIDTFAVRDPLYAVVEFNNVMPADKVMPTVSATKDEGAQPATEVNQEVPRYRPLAMLVNASRKLTQDPSVRQVEMLIKEINKDKVDPLEQKLREGMIRLLSSLDRRATLKQLSVEQNRLQVKEALESYARDERMPKGIQELAQRLLKDLNLSARGSKVLQSPRNSLSDASKENVPNNPKRGPKV